MASPRFRTLSREQRDHRIARVGAVVALLLIATLAIWAHTRSSARQQDSLNRTAAAAPSAVDPQMRVQLRAWLTQSEPLINALVIARNNIAAAAAEHNLAGTGAACQSATVAVADLHRQLPSPEPTLTNSFQQAISDYGVGLPYCIGASHVLDGDGMQRAAGFITQADAAMAAALDFLGHVPGCEPRDVGVLIV
jgi:hypothetical protein